MNDTDTAWHLLAAPTIQLWAPLTERDAALDAWHKAVATYHHAKTDENAAICEAAYARKEAAPRGVLVAGPASPICPF